jgi:hypothetical protein
MSNASNIEERPHARRSASSLPTIALCFGYESRQTLKQHWVTKQGTRGHAALEDGDTGDLESGYEDYMVGLCEDYAARQMTPGAIVQEEVKIATVEGRWGYTDRIIFHMEDLVTRTGVADMIDWKFVKAKEVIDAEVNLQGIDYVTGLFMDPENWDLHTIRVHFVMPRFGSVSTHTFYRSDLPRLQLELLILLRKAKGSDHHNFKGKELTPSYDACRFCKHLGRCRATRSLFTKIVDKYRPDHGVDLTQIPEETHASAEHLTPQQRGQLQVMAGIAEEWARAVKFHNSQAALENPDAVEGFGIDIQKGRRAVTSVAGLLYAAEEFGLTSDDLIECGQLAFGKVETKIREKAPRGEKGQRVKDFDTRLRELDAIEDAAEIPKLVRKTA